MRPGRIVLGGLLLVLAIVAALLAADLRNWQAAVRSGDLNFARDPASASWKASTVLPSDPALKLMGISSQLELRRAAQSFVAVLAAGCGIDNCFTEAKTRGDLEARLTTLASGANRARDSQADNLLGILAFSDNKASLGNAPEAVDQSVGDFRAAVQLDPTSADAKYNLEWLLQQLKSGGKKNGSTGNVSTGKSTGSRAGQGVPNHGY